MVTFNGLLNVLIKQATRAHQENIWKENLYMKCIEDILSG